MSRCTAFHLFTAGIALALGSAALAQTSALVDLRSAGDPALQTGLERTVRELGLDEQIKAKRLALALVDISRPEAPRLAMLNGDHLMYAASLPKIAILYGALAEADQGRLPLNDNIVDAMTRMIRYSSNDDATRVLSRVGGERLLEILQTDRHRFYDPREGGGLWVGKAYGKEAAFHRDPLRNLSHGATAYQVARLYYLLGSDALLSGRSNAMMKEILSRPSINHKFVKALSGIPDAKLYRKSGTWKDFHADSALVEYGQHRYIMVGIAEHAQGGEWLEQLGRRMHDLVVSAPGKPLAGG